MLKTRTRTGLIALAGVAAIAALPAAASAQWRGDNYGRQGDYYRDRGGYDYGQFNGYPEFNGIKAHIKREIQEGWRDGSLEPDDARAFQDQYKDIIRREHREFGAHGWNLPWDDRQEIRQQLSQLDHDVDEARGED